MKVIILGAGVIGVTSAWFLAQAGHEVIVLDRQSGPGLETSFANGGQISVSNAGPWANPHTPLKVLKWLFREDAPLLFRPRLDPDLWRWGARFLYECLPGRTRKNTLQLLALGRYSQAVLGQLRRDTGIEYDQLARGILQIYTDQREFDAAVGHLELLGQYDCHCDVKTPTECTEIEPALKGSRVALVGGIYAVDDESGDAHKFTQQVADLCAGGGVQFRFETRIEALEVATGSNRILHARLLNSSGQVESINGDAYIVALGSYSALLLRPIGIRIAVYPAKGYSITIPTAGHRGAPRVSLTDDAHKIVFSRLGDRLRAAGTVELNGYDGEMNPIRCEAIAKRTFELFPDAGPRDQISFWAGLRPATPSNVPIIGHTPYTNLFLNTGHGTLGWTLACGSGKALAEIVDGRKPEVEFPFQYEHLSNLTQGS